MREKELRLALVCNGGISLAVYMHGITKEVWHLARASQAFHDGDQAIGATATVYRELLSELQERGQTRVRVLADIIAGASAGGINGIFLGQAIATGQSLDPLTDLWLHAADVEQLIDPDAAPASRYSKAWALPLAWLAAGRSAPSVEALDEATQAEVRAKLSHFVRSRWFEPPFGGAALLRLLLDALAAMKAGPRGPRLLPPGQPLDLFVTVTDFSGHPERLRLNSPAEVVETEHRVVVGFSDPGDGTDTLADPAELAFAARATSSFPGAFPPFQVRELDGVLEERHAEWPGRGAFLSRILPRATAASAVDKVSLIDGSVLANAPFRPAIEALSERPARRQVDRRFVYVDPSPGIKLGFRGTGENPGFFQTILGAISELPRQQPIRDNLETLTDRSARIDRMRGVLSAVRPEVEAQIDKLFGRTLFLDRPTPARLASWRKRALEGAIAQAGYAYSAYRHLKHAHVVDAVTRLLHLAADQETRLPDMRDAVAKLAIERGYGGGGPAEIDFLRQLDLGYRLRRLRLLARRLADLETETNDAAALAPAREAIYGALANYLDLQRTPSLAGLRDQARAVHEDAGAAVDQLATTLALQRLDAETDSRLAEALAGIDRTARRALLLTYLGFPFYDVATLPLLQGEGLDEFDPILVDRISPDDAIAIRSGGAAATLKGIQFGSFGAFFSRAYRENDYLWGRLHGADRLVDIVVSTLQANVRLKPGRVAALKRAAFLAILDEEQGRLSAIKHLFEQLRAEIG